jgi:hypothetical protein
VQRALIQSRQQRSALSQAFGKNYLTSHGSLGDFSHLRLYPLQVGYFVYRFDGEQGGIHIHRYQPKIPESRSILDKSKVEFGLCAIFGDMFAPVRIFQPECLADYALYLVRASELCQLP